MKVENFKQFSLKMLCCEGEEESGEEGRGEEGRDYFWEVYTHLASSITLTPHCLISCSICNTLKEKETLQEINYFTAVSNMIEVPVVHVPGPPGHEVQDFERRSHSALLHELVHLNHATD